MVICDRCGSGDRVVRSTAEFYQFDRPADPKPAKAADLCRSCREAVQRIIAEAFEPLPREAPEARP